QALRGIPLAQGDAITALFVGAGELESSLREMAHTLEAERGIRTVFAGFVNQSKLTAYYLASDTVVLPSRRAGETWGLVVNEALQAGCGVVVSEAVGCHRDFGSWERFRVIPVGDAARLATALAETRGYPRDSEWAVYGMGAYTVEKAADAIAIAMVTTPGF
ncbi:MAG TPA: glycosyltransferase, partial [Methylophilus sp.]